MGLAKEPRRPRPASAALSTDGRGDALVEYVILVGLVAIVVLPALIATGVDVVIGFEHLRNLVSIPIP